MDKRKLSLFAKIFGKKYFIKITDDLKEDEILIIGRKIYIFQIKIKKNPIGFNR